MLNDQPKFFASMNTSKGFQSYFGKIFDTNELKQIYILKGGPGTGKSGMMKKIAEEEIKRGCDVEAFLCSSDPDSLDGIILTDKKIAVLDGTLPHNYEPEYPGIIENIINLGEFWEETKLIKHKREIEDLTAKKKRAYQRSYRFLSACGKLGEDILGYASRQLYDKKMKKNLAIQTSYFFKKQTQSRIEVRNTSTISNQGIVTLKTFEEKCNKIWIVEDHLYTAHLYLSDLLELAKEAYQDCVVSFSPMFPNLPNALYFPTSKACFVIGKRIYENEIENKEYHYINMKRFLNTEQIKTSKEKIKFAQKCLDELLDGAIGSLREAAKIHQEIEKYYISAMNYKKVDEITDKIIHQYD